MLRLASCANNYNEMHKMVDVSRLPAPQGLGIPPAISIMKTVAAWSGALALTVQCGIQAAQDGSPNSAPPLPAPPPPAVDPIRIESRTNSIKAPLLKMVSPGLFELGEIKLNQRQRTVAFPAVLNMKDGELEYFLVTSYGKKHESLLRTEVQPYHIHLAMLFLNVETRPSTVSTPPPAHIQNPSSAPIPGNKITIEVSWQAEGKAVSFAAEELLFNVQARTALSQDAWVYNGSSIWDGRFLAQREGSLVSLVTDLSALINNSGPGHDNDRIWTANAGKLPPVNTPVTVTLHLPGRPASK